MRPALINDFESRIIGQNADIQAIFETIRSGDIVEVNYKTSSAKAKKSLFVGVCIAKRSKGISSSLTVRNYVMGEAVEYTFFPHSLLVDDIRIVAGNKPRPKFRRAKLYYLRSRTPKESTVS